MDHEIIVPYRTPSPRLASVLIAEHRMHWSDCLSELRMHVLQSIMPSISTRLLLELKHDTILAILPLTALFRSVRGVRTRRGLA